LRWFLTPGSSRCSDNAFAAARFTVELKKTPLFVKQPKAAAPILQSSGRERKHFFRGLPG
jgi:hypothetical protein